MPCAHTGASVPNEAIRLKSGSLPGLGLDSCSGLHPEYRDCALGIRSACSRIAAIRTGLNYFLQQDLDRAVESEARRRGFRPKHRPPNPASCPFVPTIPAARVRTRPGLPGSSTAHSASTNPSLPDLRLACYGMTAQVEARDGVAGLLFHRESTACRLVVKMTPRSVAAHWPRLTRPERGSRSPSVRPCPWSLKSRRVSDFGASRDASTRVQMAFTSCRPACHRLEPPSEMIESVA